MTVAITEYTDTDKVRAALGVDSVDVGDDTLVDMQLDLELLIDLAGWATGYEDYAGLSLSMLKLYAASFCALSALNGRELLFPILFKDGKAETRRFALDLEVVKNNLAARLAAIKKSLIKQEDLTVTAEARSSFIMGRVPPSYDPVTGG